MDQIPNLGLMLNKEGLDPQPVSIEPLCFGGGVGRERFSHKPRPPFPR